MLGKKSCKTLGISNPGRKFSCPGFGTDIFHVMNWRGGEGWNVNYEDGKHLVTLGMI